MFTLFLCFSKKFFSYALAKDSLEYANTNFMTEYAE